MHQYIHKNILYPDIHKKIHELEYMLATIINTTDNVGAVIALEQARDTLIHQVAEYVRTAEAK